jgi:hypothetical protein
MSTEGAAQLHMLKIARFYFQSLPGAFSAHKELSAIPA